MEQDEMTPWFDALKHKPVYSGWYEFQFGAMPIHQRRFVGGQWQTLTGVGGVLKIEPGDRWRGLVKEA